MARGAGPAVLQNHVHTKILTVPGIRDGYRLRYMPQGKSKGLLWVLRLKRIEAEGGPWGQG